MGHVLELILQRNPGLPGRFVVQDVEEIVSLADPNEKAFEVMAHDFFTPQPIKGEGVLSVVHLGLSFRWNLLTRQNRG